MTLEEQIGIELAIIEALSSLTPREQKVIELRIGLNGERSNTLKEVGIIFKVTRERIRQIEAKALRKLRHPSRSRKLKSYYVKKDDDKITHEDKLLRAIFGPF